jgi:hypothetical protein
LVCSGFDGSTKNGTTWHQLTKFGSLLDRKLLLLARFSLKHIFSSGKLPGTSIAQEKARQKSARIPNRREK